MIGMKVGKVIDIIQSSANKTHLLVQIGTKHHKAINYNRLTGPVSLNDAVLLNTTAVDLSLGTGGFHFVISNLNNPSRDISDNGHIMKLRYSPYQVKVYAAEEQESEYHPIFNSFKSLDNMPVIVGTLHSMLAPVVEVLFQLNSSIKIAYIMTDGAALPIDFSNVVDELKARDMIKGTITIGHAFGGDLDCINIYNGLIAAKEILNCDITIVTMGPGIAGTGTPFGFSGIEQGHIIDAVNELGGIPIAVPRISFADKRQRHYGISHHTLTVLSRICKTKAIVGIPTFNKEEDQYIKSQLQNSLIDKAHHIIYMGSNKSTAILENSFLKLNTMGRGYEEDKEYFITLGIAAELGFMILADHQLIP